MGAAALWVLAALFYCGKALRLVSGYIFATKEELESDTARENGKRAAAAVCAGGWVLLAAAFDNAVEGGFLAIPDGVVVARLVVAATCVVAIIVTIRMILKARTF